VRTALRSKDAALKEVSVGSGVWPLFKYKARGDYGTPYMDYSPATHPEDMDWVVWRDFNADGWFDQRLVERKVQISLEDQWVQVTKTIRGVEPADLIAVTDQGAYRFDATKGEWIEVEKVPTGVEEARTIPAEDPITDN